MTDHRAGLAEFLELITNIPGGLAFFNPPPPPERLDDCWHLVGDAANDDHRKTAA